MSQAWKCWSILHEQWDSYNSSRAEVWNSRLSLFCPGVLPRNESSGIPSGCKTCTAPGQWALPPPLLPASMWALASASMQCWGAVPAVLPAAPQLATQEDFPWGPEPGFCCYLWNESYLLTYTGHENKMSNILVEMALVWDTGLLGLIPCAATDSLWLFSHVWTAIREPSISNLPADLSSFSTVLCSLQCSVLLQLHW